MEIHGSSNSHCVERGISTMRMALGYEKGLPQKWPVDLPKKVEQLVRLCGLAFPDRAVQAWYDNSLTFSLPHNVTRMGEWRPQSNYDDWLTAFAYENKEKTSAHFVVGEPGCMDKVMLVISIKI